MAYQALHADGSRRNLTEHFDPDFRLVARWQRQWVKYADENCGDRGSSNHWEWPLKSLAFEAVDECVLVAFEAGGECQGMMLLKWPMPSHIGFHQVAYVDFLEVAPWNRGDLVDRPEYKLVGQNLLSIAVLVSMGLGFGGGVRLSSLPTAEGFYDHIGMVRTGTASDNLNCFEFTEAGSQAFLARLEVL